MPAHSRRFLLARTPEGHARASCTLDQPDAELDEFTDTYEGLGCTVEEVDGETMFTAMTSGLQHLTNAPVSDSIPQEDATAGE